MTGWVAMALTLAPVAAVAGAVNGAEDGSGQAEAAAFEETSEDQALSAATDPAEQPTGDQTPMTQEATGSFEVKLAPLELHHEGQDALLGRMSIDKVFEGDLDATSTGEMLSARTALPQSAGYVAIERVEGTLGGRRGTFVLQHSSWMQGGEQHQGISVVPDSGTGELEGLAGSMVIEIQDGEHAYRFEYTLPE